MESDLGRWLSSTSVDFVAISVHSDDHALQGLVAALGAELLLHVGRDALPKGKNHQTSGLGGQKVKKSDYFEQVMHLST